MVSVKQGDKLPITFTVNHNLTAAIIRLIVRHLTRDGAFEVLPHTVTDAANGVVVHNLDGTWGVGRHFIELEITQGSEIRTAPTKDTYVIRVTPDLDAH